MNNLLENLKSLLQKDERFMSEGELLKNKIIELALKLDKDLIELLLSDEKIKEVFFKQIGKATIFDKDKFVKFVSNKQFLPDSYTAFKNKIGLIDEKDEFISEKKEVVLSWPYKDCILEGGMTKEEQKRDEIFWNETLAPDEISRLLDPKVCTNAKRIDKSGEHKFDNFKTDENGDIKDNLIIKGNNLLALHSLKKRFAGKVKLIYIDPPFNTGDDSFGYNDRFSHSTWLVFMKNRLEVAREFLADEGAIFVQISNSPTSLEESPEFGYLLVLMDEVFGRKNYITTFTWKKKGGASNTEKNIGTITESILMYAKNFSYLDANLKEYKRDYKYEDDNGPYNLEHPVKTNQGTYARPTMIYVVKTPEGKFYPPRGKRWTIGEDEMKNYISRGKYVVEDGILKIKKYPEDYAKGEFKLFNNLFDKHGSMKSAKNELASLGFNREDFSSPKPEILIKSILEIASKKRDLVMDFFAGSGTTGAVALKMERKFILIEQIENQMEITRARLKKVINSEQGGISKLVGWQGGGDFVYLELAKWNENFVEKIQKAKTKEELKKLWETMKEKAFLSYKVDVKTIDENAKDFEDLSIENQKRFLLECLDKNHLYVNYSEIDDEEYRISKEDKKLNKRFYKYQL